MLGLNDARWLVVFALTVACNPSADETEDDTGDTSDGSGSTGESESAVGESGSTAGESGSTTDDTATTVGDTGADSCHQISCTKDCGVALDVAPSEVGVAVTLSGPEICERPVQSISCEAQTPCPTFTIAGNGICDIDDDDPTLSDLAAYQCAFEAIRDGAVGLYTWQICPGQSFEATIAVHVLDDGSFVLQNEYFDDLVCGYLETRAAAASAEVLEACAAATDPYEQAACMQGSILGDCLPYLDTCP